MMLGASAPGSAAAIAMGGARGDGVLGSGGGRGGDVELAVSRTGSGGGEFVGLMGIFL